MIRVNNAYKTFRTHDNREVKALVDFSSHIKKVPSPFNIAPEAKYRIAMNMSKNRIMNLKRRDAVL